MRTYILICVLLSATLVGHTQYTYWNNVLNYSTDTVGCLVGYLEQTSYGYLSLGGYASTSTNGVYWNKLNTNGEILDFGYVPVPLSSFGGGGGYTNTSYLKLNNGNYLNTRDRDFPYWVLLDENMDTLWTLLYSEIAGVSGSAVVNENEFITTCLAPNHTELRFIHANTNHEILSDALWSPTLQNGEGILDPLFAMQGNGDTLLLCGHRERITNGIDDDFQVYLMKTDFMATDVQVLELGNPNSCFDLAPGIIKMPNGNVLMLYSKCLTQSWFNEITVEFHAVEINTNNMSIVNENVLDLGAVDDGVLGQLDVYRLIKNPYGGYLAFVQYVGAGGVGLVDYLVKIDDSLQVEWINPYHTDLAGDIETIIDVISTSDGGYAATGMSLGELQRQWAFKIDACGYEEPSGCPAIVDIEKLNDLKIEKLSIWPNPFYGQLKAVLPLNAKRIFITDAIGRVVYQENVYYPNQEWNLGFLEDGVYMMNVETEDSNGACGITIGQRVVKR